MIFAHSLTFNDIVSTHTEVLVTTWPDMLATVMVIMPNREAALL